MGCKAFSLHNYALRFGLNIKLTHSKRSIISCYYYWRIPQGEKTEGGKRTKAVSHKRWKGGLRRVGHKGHLGLWGPCGPGRGTKEVSDLSERSSLWSHVSLWSWEQSRNAPARTCTPKPEAPPARKLAPILGEGTTRRAGAAAHRSRDLPRPEAQHPP